MPNPRSFAAALMLLLVPAVSHAALQYDLTADIDPAARTVTGTAVISADATEDVRLHIADMVVENVSPAGEESGDTLTVRVSPESPVTLQYRMNVTMASAQRGLSMDADNVFFHGPWYPVPDSRASYRTTVRLPEDFLAVSEAESVVRSEADDAIRTEFVFDHLVDAVTLVASRNYRTRSAMAGDTVVEAYFFDEDSRYMDDYIGRTVGYIKTYESLIGPFPYTRFAVVENSAPTGWSLPTYTLLGRQVVRLPFILDTSLGHEVLHQYFGASVEIDRSSGNWAEGLTTFLADHYYAEQNGEGAAYRYRMLVNYKARVPESAERPVVSFTNPGHAAGRALGYGKVAMVFNMLRFELGTETFMDGIRLFFRENTGGVGSWDDIRAAMEEVSGSDLSWFFDQWLTRAGAPLIGFADAEVAVVGHQYRVRLNLHQFQDGDAYRLKLPVRIDTVKGAERRTIEMDGMQATADLFVDAEPMSVSIDDTYDVFRRLAPEEFPPVVARLFGATHVMLVLPDRETSDAYQPFIDLFRNADHHVVFPDEVSFDNLSTHTMVAFGAENPVLDRVFASREEPRRGVFVDVRENPFGDEEFAFAVIHASSAEEAAAAARKIPHYGTYTELAFRSGRNTLKVRGEPVQAGLTTALRQPSRAVPLGMVDPIESMVSRMQGADIIFVGEKHDEYAHHVNQLKVIRAMHATGTPIAIGLEMFQRPMQEHLDAYVAGEITEAEMLDRTEYFERWRFDWNLYAPILRFARDNGIPLVALNVDADITAKVAKGGFDSLSSAERAKLPETMSFSDVPYRERLRRIFSFHTSRTGRNNFDYFLQSQVLWDEVMASSIHGYLEDNPRRTMVVIAGNGHLQYLTSIPNRAVRRGGYDVSVILQDMDLEPGIADWVLMTDELKGYGAPKLGVMLDESDGELMVMDVVPDSPAYDAEVESGDVIVSFSGHDVNTVGELKALLAEFAYGDTAPVTLRRGGLMSDFTVTFPEPEEEKRAPHGKMGGVNPHTQEPETGEE